MKNYLIFSSKHIKIAIITFLLIYGFCNNSNAITLVYGMKIRRIFSSLRNFPKTDKKKRDYIVTAVPIVYKRDQHIVDTDLGINIYEKRRASGSLFNIHYIASTYWWLEATLGIEKECLSSRGTSSFDVCKKGLDDIIIVGGKNFFCTKKAQLAVYTLAGFPVEKDVTLLEEQGALVGTRCFSIGAGSELSYDFINSLSKYLVGVFQVRLLHFFNRPWFPILPYNATIQPGNVLDLLWTLQYRTKTNAFEVGYNDTFFTNQAIILENQTRRASNFVRKSFYISFNHTISNAISDYPLILGGGVSSSTSERFNTQIFSAWGVISMSF